LLSPRPTPPLFPYTTLFRSYNPYVVLPDVVSRLPQPGKTYVDPAGRSHGCVPRFVRFCRRHPGRRCLRQVTAGWTLPVLRTQNRSEEHTSELQSRSDLVCRL